VSYRVTVDKLACISAGRCVDEAPEAFGFDADELSEALPGASALADDELLVIAQNCPSGAIKLLDENGAQVELF